MNKTMVAAHPALTWYATYVIDLTTAFTTTSPSKYYCSYATLINADQSTIKGPDTICNHYMHVYGQFEKCVHDHIRTFALSNDEFGTHMLVVEMINNLHLKDGKGVVPLPQAFTYELSPAQEGAGTYGLQICKERCYFDMGLLQRAANA
ncbi:hypothetical protein BDV36DRAFT_290577 [Aspergillus pseudocaelatus]|nr:hypothetical protein BDV36DRAFT_290577 [Aspergillus pseudocaelatus]